MHVRRALALTLTVPLLLAGCSDDPDSEPKMPDPTATSSAPSPSESETAEAESPEEFIRRWAAAEAKMENTGRTDAYVELSKGCRACTDLADLVEQWYSAGGFIRWSGWKVQSVKPRGDSQNEFVVRVNSGPTEYKESENGPLKTLDGGPSAHLLILSAAGDSWVVTHKAEVPR